MTAAKPYLVQRAKPVLLADGAHESLIVNKCNLCPEPVRRGERVAHRLGVPGVAHVRCISEESKK